MFSLQDVSCFTGATDVFENHMDSDLRHWKLYAVHSSFMHFFFNHMIQLRTWMSSPPLQHIIPLWSVAP